MNKIVSRPDAPMNLSQEIMSSVFCDRAASIKLLQHQSWDNLYIVHIVSQRHEGVFHWQTHKNAWDSIERFPQDLRVKKYWDDFRGKYIYSLELEAD